MYTNTYIYKYVWVCIYSLILAPVLVQVVWWSTSIHSLR